MQLIRNLLEHKLAVLLVLALFICQAAGDLALPTFTSNIVDTGIQAGGVEDVACEALTERTHDCVAMMLSEEDEALFQASYDKQSDGTYKLNASGESNRDALDEVMAIPMIATEYSSQIEGFDLDQTLAAYQAGLVTKSDILPAMEAASAKLEANESLLEQQAIAAAQAEYEALGYDMSSLQMRYLRWVGLLMALVALGTMVADACGNLIAARTSAKIGRDLRERLFAKVLSFSEAEVDKFSSASLITRGTNDIQQIQNVSFMIQRMALYVPVLAIGGIIAVAKTNLSMWWVIVLGIVLVVLIAGVLMAFTMPKFKVMQQLVDKVNLVSREILTGLPVIRAFGRESHEAQRFDQASTELMKTQLFTNRAMSLMMPTMQLIMNGLSVLIVWVGGHHIDAGTMQTGDLIAFITYSIIIVMSFLFLGMIAVFVPRANVAAERVAEVLAMETSITDPEIPATLAFAEGSEGATITLDDVSFAYAGGTTNVLEHVSFTAEAGKTCAIIGATGCGKSTIIKLIERFYDVSEGRVLIDGVDVRDIPQSELRRQLGYSPQQAFLFSGTIESNVSYADSQMGQERSRNAIEVAQTAEFVDSKEEGAQAPIAQGGSNVSGGQRQRLSIARALAADARAYLFDDSFSALDYKTDARLRSELEHRMKGKTVIIVAQRIATIMHADQIIVLEDGKVVGKGTHEELLTSCDEYLKIAQSQLSPQELEKGGVR